MKRLLTLLLLAVCANGFAADYANPYSPQPLPLAPSMGGMPHPIVPSLDDPLPQAFTENRSLFDIIEVVGRGRDFAVLRYPTVTTSSTGQAGAATSQGIAYRELIVKSDKTSFIGGRSFKAVLPGGGTNVLLVDGKNGKVLWEGDLSGPKVYYTSPNMMDYQYSPPLSAGAGVGQTPSGTMSVSGQTSTGQTAQTAGTPR